jgi:hypothetical protein
MAGIEIKVDVSAIKKVERLRRGTGVTFTRFSRSVGRKVANKHKPKLIKDLRKYAKKRPRQRYKRTFRLRRGWKVNIRTPQSGFVVDVTNKTPYTHFVVGRPDMRMRAGGKGQAWMHKGRWWIAGGVVKKHFDNIQDDYEQELLDTLEDQAGVTVTRRSKLLR